MSLLLALTGGSGPANYTLTAQGGVYSLAGAAATVNHSRLLTVSGGSYTVTGQPATIRLGKVLVANGGAYTLAGAQATIKLNKLLTASGGAYALTGGAATIKLGKFLTATGGAYSLAGGGATITKAGGATNYVLTALGGEYLIGGSSASLNVATTAPLGGGIKLRSAYQYQYQKELDKLEPEVADAITAKAIEVVSQEASQAQAREALERMGIAYREAYQEIFEQLVVEMRQAQEDEQVALVIASIL